MQAAAAPAAKTIRLAGSGTGAARTCVAVGPGGRSTCGAAVFDFAIAVDANKGVGAGGW